MISGRRTDWAMCRRNIKWIPVLRIKIFNRKIVSARCLSQICSCAESSVEMG